MGRITWREIPVALSVIAALLGCGLMDQDEKAAASATSPPPPAPTPAAAESAAAETPKPEAAEEEAPPEDEGPIPAIPEGRSKPPTVAEWNDAREVNTQGPNSQPPHCFMKIVREWLKVHCEGDIIEVTDMEGFGKEQVNYFQSIKPGKSADFVVRLSKGNTMKLRIWRKEDRASLFVNWPGAKDRPVHVALGKGPPK